MADTNGREVVLLVRIWENKITRDHPELVGHLNAVVDQSRNPIMSSPTRCRTAHASIGAMSARAGG